MEINDILAVLGAKEMEIQMLRQQINKLSAVAEQLRTALSEAQPPEAQPTVEE